jgi:hypothetical protein
MVADAEPVLALIRALADYEKLQGPDEAARDGCGRGCSTAGQVCSR